MEEGSEQTSPQGAAHESPSREDLEDNANSIKGTGYSKSWVISILLDLLKEVEKHTNMEEKTEDSDSSEGAVDVAEQQQTDLSSLWDMSLNKAVSRFLMESDCNAVDIFISALYKSRAPRINEICTGILGNMCSVHDVCVNLTETTDLVKLICAVLSNIEFDSPTVRETMRLALTCLNNSKVKTVWVKALLDTPDLTKLLLFILESARDVALLRYTGDLMTSLMEAEDALCESWASTQLVYNILVAIKQIGHKEKEDIKSLLSVLYLLSTSQTGVQSLIDNGEGVMKALVTWIRVVCDEDILVITDHVSIHGCVISILNILFLQCPTVAHYLCSSSTVFKDMMKTLDAMYNIYPAHDNPATLPHCILPHPHPKHSCQNTPGEQSLGAAGDSNSTVSAAESTTGSMKVTVVTSQGSVSSDDRNEENSNQSCRQQKVEENGRVKGEEEEERQCVKEQRTYDPERQLFLTLFESLQDYFRNTFSHMYSKMRKELSSDSESNDEEERPRVVTQFHHVLKHLETCPRRQLSYLISVLVYAIPDTDAWQQGDTSPEGW